MSVSIDYVIPSSSSKNKKYERLKEARRYFLYCAEKNVTTVTWRSLRKWSSLDISKPAAKKYWKAYSSGILDNLLSTMEDKAKRSKSERAIKDLNKKRKKRSNLERKRLPYTGLSERTIRQRELELVEALVRLSAENILKVLERKDVVNHLGQNLVQKAKFGDVLLSRAKVFLSDKVHPGRLSKVDEQVRDVVVDLMCIPDQSLTKNAGMLGLCRSFFFNTTRQYQVVDGVDDSAIVTAFESPFCSRPEPGPK